jgi:hypothetical protein
MSSVEASDTPKKLVELAHRLALEKMRFPGRALPRIVLIATNPDHIDSLMSKVAAAVQQIVDDEIERNHPSGGRGEFRLCELTWAVLPRNATVASYPPSIEVEGKTMNRFDVDMPDLDVYIDAVTVASAKP